MATGGQPLYDYVMSADEHRMRMEPDPVCDKLEEKWEGFSFSARNQAQV